MGLAGQRERLAARVAAQRAELFGTDAGGDAIRLELAPARASAVGDDVADGVLQVAAPRGGTTFIFPGLASGLARRTPQAESGGGWVLEHDGSLRWAKSLGVAPQPGDRVRVLSGAETDDTRDGIWMRVASVTNNPADPEWRVSVAEV